MGYDATDRLLTEVQTPDSGNTVTTTYAYDAANNRLSSARTDGTETVFEKEYQYNLLNQLTQEADTQNNTLQSYAYDLSGNRLSKTGGSAGQQYAYDGENRLITLTQSGQGAGVYRYAYDYRTRRTMRDESGASGQITRVVFSGGTSQREYVGSTISGTLSPTVEFIRGSDYGGGIGGILYSLRGSAVGYKHYNSRGDVTGETNPSGSLTYQAAYEAFGKHGGVAGTQEWGGSADRQRANTKDEDPTGLLNEGFRYRDLDTGTFLTRDPLGFVDGPNLYTYVNQNPWTKFDPEGLEWWNSWTDYKRDFKTGWDATLGHPRVQGAGAAIGGAAEMTVGALATVAPEPTMATKIGGLALLAHGADVASAGIMQMINGRPQKTMTHQAVEGSARFAGASPETANMVAWAADMGISVLGTGRVSTELSWSRTFQQVPNANILSNPGANVSGGTAESAATSRLITPYYPANNGFLGNTEKKFLMPGQLIDRYGGSDASRFFSPAGTPEIARALPLTSNGQRVRSFEVIKPFEVTGGRVAPAFGKIGLGEQFMSPIKLGILLKRGIIKEK